MTQRFENTLFLVHSGPRLCQAIAGRNADGSARHLAREHLASNETARAEGARLGLLYWGPNGGPIAPIDAPYPGKGYSGLLQGANGDVTLYENDEPFTGTKHLRSGPVDYVNGVQVA